MHASLVRAIIGQVKATSHQNRRLIVHAGMHKTGTTALQNYLFHHLDDPRICYLSGGRPNSTPLVRQAFDSTLAPLVRDGSSVAQRRDAARARLNTLVRHSQPVAVLSAEVICALQDEDLGTLFEFFQPLLR